MEGVVYGVIAIALQNWSYKWLGMRGLRLITIVVGLFPAWLEYGCIHRIITYVKKAPFGICYGGRNFATEVPCMDTNLAYDWYFLYSAAPALVLILAGYSWLSWRDTRRSRQWQWVTEPLRTALGKP